MIKTIIFIKKINTARTINILIGNEKTISLNSIKIT